MQETAVEPTKATAKATATATKKGAETPASRSTPTNNKQQQHVRHVSKRQRQYWRQ